MAAAEAGGVQALGALDSQMAEVEDVVSYCSDTLSIGAIALPVADWVAMHTCIQLCNWNNIS